MFSRNFDLSDHLEGQDKTTAQAIKLRLQAGWKRPPVARSQGVKVSGPGSQRRPLPHALGRKQSGEPVFDTDPLLDEIFSLAVRSFIVLLRDARRPHHAADLAISSERSRQDAQKALSIETVGLRPPCASCYENACRLNDVIDDAVIGQQAMQPKTVATSFETTGQG